MRVHLLQIAYGDDETVAERTERVAEMVRAQRGADLVVLPELWPQGGFAYRSWAEQAEPLDGPVVDAMRKAAVDLGAALHMGSIIERAPDGRLHNTSVLLGPDGSTVATYRKVHLFGFGEGEPVLLSPGTEVVTAEVDGTVVGLATCYDLRFPEMFRALLDAGARVMVLPAAWPAARVEHWTLLARARAIENQCVVLACNTAGTHAGQTMGGASAVIDATGTVLAEAGTREEVLVADVDTDQITSWRDRFPVLADRRLG